MRGSRTWSPHERRRLATAAGLLPDRGDGPVFREPWEAQAFALVLALHARGVFTWNEWAAALAAQIAAARDAGDADLGDTYYHHWLATLEAPGRRQGRQHGGRARTLSAAWNRAAERTPHGSPIDLRDADFAA